MFRPPLAQASMRPHASGMIRPSPRAKPAPLRQLALLGALALATLAGCASKTNGYGAPSAAALMQAEQEADARSKTATPDSKELYLSMIRQMQEQGAYFATLAHLDAYRLQYGTTPEVDRLRADALRETGQPAEAEAAYKQLLGGPEAAAAWHGLGLIAAQRQDFPGAVRALREAVNRSPTEAFYLSDLGFALLQMGDVAAARVPIAQAAELEPGNRKVLSNLAVYLLVAGERNRAEKMMSEAQMPPATRDVIGKLAADIRKHIQSKARAEATTIVPAQASVATPVQAGAEQQVVVRLSDGSTVSGSAAQVAAAVASSGAGGGSASASANDAKLAGANASPRSDMPTSLLERFSKAQ